VFARLTGAAVPRLAISNTPTMLFVLTMFFTPTGSATTSRPALRRAIRWRHPISLHPIDDSVELFDDPIQTAGSIAPFGCPFILRPFLGRSHKMHTTRNDGNRRHAPRHSQPFQCSVHCNVSF
jgi:hypothetical protein